jgi:hypothetical protein
MRALKAFALSSLCAATLFTGVVGFAHTHAGRPLLVAMRPVLRVLAGSKASCPFGYDKKATPEEKAAERVSFSRAHHGAKPAPVRPALGFDLDTTTPADVLAWAKTKGVFCAEKPGGVARSDLECKDIPDGLLPESARGAKVSSLWLTFGERGTLTKIVAVRSDARAEAISDAFTRVTSDVANEAGPATAHEGRGTATELASGLLVESSAEYRFSNYYALARAANVGSAYVLTEEYRSLDD